MRRRLLLVLSTALVVGALTAPVMAAVGPTTVVQVGCSFDDVTADAVVTPGGVTRGFVSFHGGGCANVGLIFYFQGSGSTWTRAQSTLRGRVLAAADDGSSTFLLYQSSSGVWVAKRPHTGGWSTSSASPPAPLAGPSSPPATWSPSPTSGGRSGTSRSVPAASSRP